jgi:hypothetical protein
MNRAEQIYKNVLDAMQDADEIEGVEDPQEYLKLMDDIRHEAVKRYNNCADHIAWTAERFEPAKELYDE